MHVHSIRFMLKCPEAVLDKLSIKNFAANFKVSMP